MLADMSVRSDDCDEVRHDWSPCIYLSSDQCEALGLTTPPAAGTRVKLNAVAVFQIVTQAQDSDDSPTDVSATLRITHLEIGPVQGPAAKTLYGEHHE
jgi:hypothetical protein